jgi:ATP-dependent RNA helicase DDX27
MLKAAIKQASADQIRHRIIPAEAVTAMSSRLGELKDEIQEILTEEREEKMLRQADMELKKGQNIIEHEAEIFSRPARTWFQSEKEKQSAKGGSWRDSSCLRVDASKAAYVGAFPDAKTKAVESKDKIKRGKYDGMSRRDKRRKMAIEEDEKENHGKGQGAAIRAAKKTQRPRKITEAMPKPESKKSSRSKGKKGSAFDEERGSKKGSKHEGMRAKPVKVNLTKGGKSKGKARK